MSDLSEYNAIMQEALEESIRRGELGIQVAGYLDGELLFNAAAGIKDEETGEKVTTDTIFNPFSVSKAITATVLHTQVAKGLIDYSKPIAEYWPEFAANDKGDITVRDALSHRAGIPWMPEGVTPELQADWKWMISQIEQMEPAFKTDTTNSYHALIWGWIVGELVQRVDPAGRDFATIAREDVFEPLGITDLYFGVPESETHRIATLTGGIPPIGFMPDDFFKGMPVAVFPSAAVYNLPVTRAAVGPGAGVIGTAESIARIFGALANHGEAKGVRILPADLVAKFTEPRNNTEEVDVYFGAASAVGAYGYWLAGEGELAHGLLGASAHILQHPGAGDSLSWAELDTGLAVSICHNAMNDAPEQDPEKMNYRPIVDAARKIRDLAKARQLEGANA